MLLLGAIANDVHGKTITKMELYKVFKELTLITPNGKIVNCSEKKN